MSNNQYPSDDQFAGLIQAATAAADTQEHHATTSILGKRQRTPDEDLIDTQLRTAQSIGPHQRNETSQLQSNIPPCNSATIFFREPSEKSKKYSRPPLGKVYKDLELSPQRFIDLQNAAKDYMLDESHMERRNVVGHKKHSSNNEVAKLRLWSCVESFLSLLNKDGDMNNNGEVMNNGEWWFGRNAGTGDLHAPALRTFFWPEDSQKITKLLMPLFRKMVTNERQRLYARVTRGHDTNEGDKNNETDAAVSTLQSAPRSHSIADSPPMIDHTLETAGTGQELYLNDGHPQDVDTPYQLTLHINIMTTRNEQSVRIRPRINMTANALPTLEALIDEARKYRSLGQVGVASQGNWKSPIVKVWLPEGLIRVKDDGQWMVALLRASMVDWMDSELRVIIDIGHTSDLINVE